MRKFDAEEYARFIELYSITMVPLVPTIALKIAEMSERYNFSSLRYIVCAGARLDTSTQAKIAFRLQPKASFTQLWGLSELGWVTAFKHGEIALPGSVGRLLPDIEAKWVKLQKQYLRVVSNLDRIIDSHGVEMQDQEQAGDIFIRTPGMMLGYADGSATMTTSKAGDWFETGDIGYCREDKWHIIDRAKVRISSPA